MSKTYSVALIIAVLQAYAKEIDETWLCNNGCRTNAGDEACWAIRNEIRNISVYDRVSRNYVWEMENRLRGFYVYPDFN